MYKFNERLKELREERRLTQAQTAELFGLARNTIFSYETGRRVPDVEIVERMATEFGVTIDYLIGRSDNRTNEDDAIGSVTGLNDDSIKNLKLLQAEAKKMKINTQNKDRSYDLSSVNVYDIESSPEVSSMFLKMINILCSDSELLLSICMCVFEMNNDVQIKYSQKIDKAKIDESEKLEARTKLRKINQAINLARLMLDLERVQKEQLSHAKED